MHPVLQQFESRVDAILGTMVRVCFSLPRQRTELMELASEAKVPLDTLLSTGSFDPGSSEVIYAAKIDDQLHAMEDGGFDEVLIGNICASFIYSLWEDKYRLALAEAKGLDKGAITSEFFGQLGAYRHAIVHNQGLGTSKTEQLTLPPQMPRGEQVRVTRHVLESIVAKTKRELLVISLPQPAA